jgi:hypothetical protein
VAGCGKLGLGPSRNTAVTPATHTRFPIMTGPHAVDCNTCHGDFATFSQFSCMSCHGHDNQTSTDQLHQSVSGYQYTSTGCYSCHPTGARQTFDHAGINGGCTACHDVGNDFAALPVAGFTHMPTGGADCGTCHDTKSWLGATGAPPGLSHDPTRDIVVNALIPAYSGTTISSLSAQAETLNMPMSHTTSQVTPAALSACTNCHPNATAGTYYPGDLHSTLANMSLAEPTACSDCHGPSMPTGFVGPTATSPARTPASGEMKHDAVGWTNGAPTTTKLVTQDCGACHASPSPTINTGASWATTPAGATTAVYHSALSAAGAAQPMSCVDCHANSRPNAVLSSPTYTLPSSVQFDHTTAAALADCASCHTGGYTAWSGGKFHLAGSATPSACLPCHAGERPTSTATWTSPPSTTAPFDFVTNASGITHGDGQDCVVCHNGPGTGGTWGGTQSWVGGSFDHTASGSMASTTCIACHTTQRPDLVLGASTALSDLGFDHSQNGTGDCIGCHYGTTSYVSYYAPGTTTLPGGNWGGAVQYPGNNLVGSPSQFVTITEITLNRSGANNLVTSMSSASATLYNEMLHTSSQIPSPQMTPNPVGDVNCWYCHTSTGTTVTSFKDGVFHPAVADAGQSQPTECTDCHTQMRPTGIVQQTDLVNMDHNAQFSAGVVIGGTSVTSVKGVDCAVCHHSPGGVWTDGLFHANVGAPAPASLPIDCTVCHYPLMADAAKANVTSGANYLMKHGSAQLAFQNCQTCHASALGKGATTPDTSTLWNGATFHANLSTQPTACTECHAVSEPAANASTQSSVTYSLSMGGTSSNGAQWMNHGSSHVAGMDCASCHAADAKTSGSAWSKSDSFHVALASPSTCQECHGLTNGGGSTAGTKNNLPTGLINSSTLTSASSDSTTGVPSGTYDQIIHTDVNVTGHDCNFCHTQVGVSSVTGVHGKEWAQAKFHPSFTAANPLVMNGTTGRCSDCHLNVKPTSSFPAFDHSALSGTSGTQDCSSCHSWPGTGTAAAPNWLGAAAMPVYINVGGFTVPAPPASSATTQQGIGNLPHPAVASGVACTTCHQTSVGGKGAHGYDHASSLINSNCKSCHEAGSNLVATVWNGVTSAASGAGDTRPFTLSSVTAKYNGNSMNVTYPNHFYPVDCYQCHVVPTGDGYTTTGTTYTSAWNFPHTQSKMTNPSTCVMCHTNGVPN